VAFFRAGIVAAVPEGALEIHQMPRIVLAEESARPETRTTPMKFTATLTTVTAVLLLAACGKQEAPAAAAPAPATAPAPAPAAVTTAANDAGKAAFGKACALCHAAGVGGAPKPGDKADWSPRIAQGTEVLYKHAIEGYNGAKGAMPPKGGSTLSDADVKAVVDYMVSLSK
jgi:cytochrome c5